MAHAADDRACGGRLTGLHAGSGESNHGNPAGIQLRILVKAFMADSSGHADALAQVGEVQYDTEYATVERLALVRVHRVTDTQHAADVQHLDDVAGLYLLRDVSRIAEQGLAMAERADHDVAL